MVRPHVLGDLLHGRLLHGGGEVTLGDVGGIDDGLGGQELEQTQQARFILMHRKRVGRLGGVEMRNEPFEQRQLGVRVLFPAPLPLVRFLDALLHRVEIGQDQLGDDDLDVADRVNGAHRVGGVVVLKAADDVHDGVDLADVGQKLVAEALALAGTGDETGDIEELDGRRDDHAGLEDLFEMGQAVVGHVDDTDVGFNGAERIVRDRRLVRAGNRVEEGGLSRVGQPDDAGFQHKDGELTARPGHRGKRKTAGGEGAAD